MQSFPLARTQTAAVRRVTARRDFHALRRRSCNRPGNEDTKTGQAPQALDRWCVGKAFWRTSSLIGSARAPQQSAHWLGTHSDSERYLGQCAVKALQSRSAGLAPRPAPARSPRLTPATATPSLLIVDRRSSSASGFCRGHSRTSEAHSSRGRLHHSHRESYFQVSYVYSKKSKQYLNDL
jgi:hypothetical protein